jgi:transposase
VRVVDSASIEVSRRKRRAKTDRIDGEALLNMLIRSERGEKKVWSVVRVPEEKMEDARRPLRELDRLKKERVQHRSCQKAVGRSVALLRIRTDARRRATQKRGVNKRSCSAGLAQHRF